MRLLRAIYTLILYVFLAVFGAVLAYLLLEFGIAPFAANWTPIKLHTFVPDAARTLIQSSKRDSIPKNYIALVGDSYAHGFGDWLIGSNPSRNGPYHSAHVIFELTKRDVITFGSSEAGSMTALVARPQGQITYLNKIPLVKVADPDVILVYFNEGNDLQDNVLDLNERFFKEHELGDLGNASLFQDFLKKSIAEQDHSFRTAQRAEFFGPLPFLRFVRHTVEPIIFNEPPPKPRIYDFKFRGKNKAMQEGKELILPDLIQAPPNELHPNDRAKGLYVFDQSLRFLRERFRESRITVVYIPSPFSCYDVTSSDVLVQTYSGGEKTFPTAQLIEGSERLKDEVSAIAVRNDTGFFDPRPALRQAAKQKILHGPIDWKHFNRDGYTTLGQAISTYLENSGLLRPR